LWHGINLPLLMSGAALGGGVLLYFLVQYGLDLHSHVQVRHRAKRLFDRAVQAVAATADAMARRAWSGGTSTGVLVLVLTALLVGMFPFLRAPGAAGEASATPVEPMAIAIFALMCAAAVGTMFAHRYRLAAVVMLSVVGLTLALAFVYFSAPDLALTQLSVETVSILLLLLALNHLPQHAPAETAVDEALRHFFLACIAGGGVGWLTWAMLTRPFTPISDYFIANSVPGGGGANVVNVILVDFRAYDTYGEIMVIAIAALGVAALLAGLRLTARPADADGRAWAGEANWLPLELLVRALLPLALLVSVFLFLRGHNAPGGGFVGGLVAAVSLVLLYLGIGSARVGPHLRIDLTAVAAGGLLCAGLTGLGAGRYGVPFLTSAHGYAELPVVGKVALASAMLFDLGVYLTVAGATLLILTLLGADAKAGYAQTRRADKPEK
jgi:multicomponent K+:H+ antiporter subunit A